MSCVGKSVAGRGKGRGRGPGRGRGGATTSTSSRGGASSSPRSVSFRPPQTTIGRQAGSSTNVLCNPPPPIQLPVEEIHEHYEEHECPFGDQEPQPAQHVAPNITIRELLEMEGRDMYLTRLDPNPIEGTIRFDRDDGILPRTISRILKKYFDGPYYSWTVTLTRVQDDCYIEFARHDNWAYVLDPAVRPGFNKICVDRMKGMVNQVKGKKQPNWIGDDLWDEMNAYWEIDYAQSRSSSASTSRNSDRGELGIHKHLAGQKSFSRIQRELEEKAGRSVSLGEVFVKTHTRADGTYVDMKAKQICDSYEKHVEVRLFQIGGIARDDTSTPQLSTDELNTIFLESTIPDTHGNLYGLGSLSQVYGKRKRGSSSCSSQTTVRALQQRLDLAHKMIEEQAAKHEASLAAERAALAKHEAALDAERLAHASTKSTLTDVVGWIKTRDPHFHQSSPNPSHPTPAAPPLPELNQLETSPISSPPTFAFNSDVC